jgi:hypothetical protein
VDDLPLSKSECSILPIARRLSDRGFRVPALSLAALLSDLTEGAAFALPRSDALSPRPLLFCRPLAPLDSPLLARHHMSVVAVWFRCGREAVPNFRVRRSVRAVGVSFSRCPGPRHGTVKMQ